VPVGALIGAGVTYGFQVAANISQNGLNVQAFTEVNWAAVGGGAVAGAVGVATFGVGTAVMGTGLGATVAAGAISGAVSGQTARATENVLSGQDVTAGLGNPGELIRDAVIGGGLAATGRIAAGFLAQSRTSLTAHYGEALPARIRPAFSGWQAEAAEFGGGTKLYRIHNIVQTGEEPYGRWWLLEPPSSEVQFRIDYAVRPEWNAAQQMSTLTIPQDATLQGWVGRAAYQGGIYVGGGVQVYLPEVPRHWVTTGPVPW